MVSFFTMKGWALARSMCSYGKPVFENYGQRFLSPAKKPDRQQLKNCILFNSTRHAIGSFERNFSDNLHAILMIVADSMANRLLFNLFGKVFASIRRSSVASRHLSSTIRKFADVYLLLRASGVTFSCVSHSVGR